MRFLHGHHADLGIIEGSNGKFYFSPTDSDARELMKLRE
jgi:hypothetical protein